MAIYYRVQLMLIIASAPSYIYIYIYIERLVVILLRCDPGLLANSCCMLLVLDLLLVALRMCWMGRCHACRLPLLAIWMTVVIVYFAVLSICRRYCLAVVSLIYTCIHMRFIYHICISSAIFTMRWHEGCF